MANSVHFQSKRPLQLQATIVLPTSRVTQNPLFTHRPEPKQTIKMEQNLAHNQLNSTVGIGETVLSTFAQIHEK